MKAVVSAFSNIFSEVTFHLFMTKFKSVFIYIYTGKLLVIVNRFQNELCVSASCIVIFNKLFLSLRLTLF